MQTKSAKHINIKITTWDLEWHITLGQTTHKVFGMRTNGRINF